MLVISGQDDTFWLLAAEAEQHTRATETYRMYFLLLKTLVSDLLLQFLT
jgi:hypothetical protein